MNEKLPYEFCLNQYYNFSLVSNLVMALTAYHTFKNQSGKHHFLKHKILDLPWTNQKSRGRLRTSLCALLDAREIVMPSIR